MPVSCLDEQRIKNKCKIEEREKDNFKANTHLEEEEKEREP